MPSILLVDDDEQMRNLLSEILRCAGHEVEVARDGQEATKLYHERSPDLIVTDLLMPEKEGLEMIMELYRSCSQIRVIAMSGGGRIDSAPLLKAASIFGAQRILHKPFSPEEFMRAVIEALPA